ncbi:MAG: radical SAM family heme chaperone HemW [Nitrospirae bacterium]|nr:radical SAM family heme chaperone HemW [Candidatus Manganitrophaceae bacterium]
MKTLGFYIDFPFCIARCAFCAFDVEGYRVRWATRYIKALEKEIEIYATLSEITGRKITSVYLGGGTPSHYPPEVLQDLLAHCQNRFNIGEDAEITLEAHPATVDKNKLSDFLKIGINRLSLGMQSFSNKQLKQLGRHHSAQEAITAFQDAREAGFLNISIDLMYGLPNESPEDWEKTLRQAITLSPEHIFYALSIEAGTLFDKKYREGKLNLCSEDTSATLYDRARKQLARADYKQYEISNFAKAGHKSRHNLRYWNQEAVLSFGVSGHSYIDGKRSVNTDKIPDYIEKLETGKLPVTEQEKILPRDAAIDHIIFGLRKTEGIPVETLSEDAIFRETRKNLEDAGLLQEESGRIQLTRKGMHFADEVGMAFL